MPFRFKFLPAIGLSVLVVIGVAIGLRLLNKPEGCFDNLAPQMTWPGGLGELACPKVGNIGGVKLAISETYLLGWVVYKGVDIWKAETYKNAPRKPSFDNDIEDFSIRVRLSNFRPIESRRDWEDFNQLGTLIAPNAPPPGNRWMNVEFKSDAVYSIRECEGSMQCGFDWIMKDVAGWGPFILQSEEEYGLKHYVSKKKPSLFSGGFDEFYFDPITRNTLITCSNKPMVAPPYVPLHFCKHEFAIPELHVMVSADYDHPAKEDLPRWREVERNVRKIGTSFTVR